MFWQAGFWSAGFWADGFWEGDEDQPEDLIQRPGLTSSDWMLLPLPRNRTIENDEALLLSMNLM